MSDQQRVRVGVSRGFLTGLAEGLLDRPLHDLFDPLPFVTHHFLPEGSEVSPDDIREIDGAIMLGERFSAASFTAEPRLAVIARWGVGYDMIDVEACTRADVLLAITVDAVRRPVSEAILTLILALAKRLPAKDRLVRTGRWDLKAQAVGIGLEGKTVGSVGLGNIGQDMFRLLEPFGLGRALAYDPYMLREAAEKLRVEMVDLDTVFRESDFVAVNCPLNAETRGMIGAEHFQLMKPTAYLVNTARGAIINSDDLVAALAGGRMAGAGLDVFEDEPLPADHPLTRLENVILSPHALGWTDNLCDAAGTDACRNVLTVLHGEIPEHTVNPEIVGRPGFQAKLRRLRDIWSVQAGRGGTEAT